jgi:hypothetical protein
MSSLQPPGPPRDPRSRPTSENLFSDYPTLPEESRKRPGERTRETPPLLSERDTNVLGPRPGAPVSLKDSAPSASGKESGKKKKLTEKPPRDRFAPMDFLMALLILVTAVWIYAAQAMGDNAPLAPAAPALTGRVSLEAFGDLVYAKSLAQGDGLTFFGKPARSFTDLIWVALLAAGSLFGSMPTLAQFAGLGFGAATFLILAAMSRSLFGRWWPGALAALALSLHFPYVVWCASGTDAGFFSFMLTLALWALTREIRRGKMLWSGLLWGLLAFTRPEAVWLAAAPALIALWTMIFGGNKTRFHSLGWLFLLSLSLAALAWVNLQISGDYLVRPLPDFQRFQADPWGALRESPAWDAWGGFWAAYPVLAAILPFAAALTLAQGPRRSAPAFAALYLCLLIYAATMFLLDLGDASGKEFAPIAPAMFLSVLGGLAIVFHHRPTRRHWPAGLLQFLTAVGGLAVICAGILQPAVERALMADEVLDASPSRLMSASSDFREALEAQKAPEGAQGESWRRLASADAAALAFYLEQPVLDLTGRHAAPHERNVLFRRDGSPSADQLAAWKVEWVHLSYPPQDTARVFHRAAPKAEEVGLYYDAAFHRLYQIADEDAEQPDEDSIRLFQHLAAPKAEAESDFPARFFDAAFRGEVAQTMKLGVPAFARFEVQNHSPYSYPSAGGWEAETGDVAVVVQWLPAEDDSASDDEKAPSKAARDGLLLPSAEFALPRTLAPGESMEFVRPLPLPAESNKTYRLQARLKMVGAPSLNAAAERLTLDFLVEVKPPLERLSAAQTQEVEKTAAQGAAREALEKAVQEAAAAAQAATSTPAETPASGGADSSAEGAATAPAPKTTEEMMESVGADAGSDFSPEAFEGATPDDASGSEEEAAPTSALPSDADREETPSDATDAGTDATSTAGGATVTPPAPEFPTLPQDDAATEGEAGF